MKRAIPQSAKECSLTPEEHEGRVISDELLDGENTERTVVIPRTFPHVAQRAFFVRDTVLNSVGELAPSRLSIEHDAAITVKLSKNNRGCSEKVRGPHANEAAEYRHDLMLR